MVPAGQRSVWVRALCCLLCYAPRPSVAPHSIVESVHLHPADVLLSACYCRITLGMAVGWLFTAVAKPPKHLRRHVLCAVALGAPRLGLGHAHA